MSNTDPKGGAPRAAHPPYGEVRHLECRDGHVAGTWWRPSSDQPFSPVDEPAAGVDIGAPCPMCDLELDEVHALIDPMHDGDR